MVTRRKKQSMSEKEAYLLLERINRKADIILAKIDALIKKFSFLDEDNPHDHKSDERVRYKA